MPRTPVPAFEAGKTIRRIPLKVLRFDPRNPRIPRSVNRTVEADLLRWMLEDATLLELMGSIGTQGYFEGDPVLVVPSQSEPDAYVVVEGNRRLAAVKLLTDPELAPTRRVAVTDLVAESQPAPDTLPCLIFDERDEVLDYLGFRHVTGIRPWDPLAKARYLRQLVEHAQRDGESKPTRVVAKKIGSRTDYVNRLLSGLAVYERAEERDFYDIPGVGEEAIDFAVLTTALGYSAIRDFVGATREAATEPKLNDKNLKDLLTWTFRPIGNGKPVVAESRDLRSLASVVAKPAALKALRGGEGLQDALQFTEQPLRLFQESLRQSRDRLERARSQLHRVELVAQDDLDVLSEITSLARDLRTVVRQRLEANDDDA